MGIKNFFLTLVIALYTLPAWAQNEFARHTVQPGETVYGIAKFYSITEAELIKYNPDIAQNLRVGDILIIPQIPKKAESYITHEVQARETLYGLSKQYNCSEEEILALNPEVKDGLKKGMVLKIPNKKPTATEPEDTKRFEYYTVQEKETVYSLCRVAGISEEEFLNLNPHVRTEGLKVGMRVKWPKQQPTTTTSLPKSPDPVKNYTSYRIEEGDNIENIAARFKMTPEELIKLNPELAQEVVVGRFILIKPGTAAKNIRKVASGATMPIVWHTPSSLNNTLRMAVLLPFYADNNDSTGAKVNDKAKMALQFWAGFQVGLDTLAAMGYNITVDVYDTQNDSRRVEGIAKNIHPDVDIIVGPLYAKNAEYLAKALPNKTIVSPLSKTLENEKLPNLVNSAVNSDGELKAIARYINQIKQPVNVVFWNLDTIASEQNVAYVKRYINHADVKIQEVWLPKSGKNERKMSDYKMDGRKNLYVIVDNDMAFLSSTMNKIRGTQDTNMVLLGTSKLLELKTIETRYMSSINFRAFESDYINYSDTATQQFILKFREKTNTEPNKFGFYGFDTALYFAQIASAKKEFDNFPWPIVQGIIQGFLFVENGNGATNNEYLHTLRIKEMMLMQVD